MKNILNQIKINTINVKEFKKKSELYLILQVLKKIQWGFLWEEGQFEW